VLSEKHAMTVKYFCGCVDRELPWRDNEEEDQERMLSHKAEGA